MGWMEELHTSEGVEFVPAGAGAGAASDAGAVTSASGAVGAGALDACASAGAGAGCATIEALADVREDGIWLKSTAVAIGVVWSGASGGSSTESTAPNTQGSQVAIQAEVCDEASGFVVTCRVGAQGHRTGRHAQEWSRNEPAGETRG